MLPKGDACSLRDVTQSAQKCVGSEWRWKLLPQRHLPCRNVTGLLQQDALGAFGGTGVTTYTAPQFSKSKTCPIQDMTRDSVGSCVTGLHFLSPIFIVTLECMSSYKDAVMDSLSLKYPERGEPELRGCLCQVGL